MNEQLFPFQKYSFNNEDLFSELSDELVGAIKKNSVLIHYKSGESIFKEEDDPTGIYRVIKGKVKKFTSTNFGTDHVFYVCKELEYLGYHAILSLEAYADSAAALTDCSVLFTPKDIFLDAVNESHQLSQRLLKSLSHEFGVFLNATKLLAKHTVRERTAINLLILHDKFKTGDSEDVEIIIHREDLANMVGTAIESVVRMLKEFKEDNFIKTKGSTIVITNLSALLKVSHTY